jgi:tetratricopeptide (TPR) repeat protein
MNWKTVILSMAGLTVLGWAIFTRSPRTAPVSPPEQAEPLSTRRAFKPRLPAPRMAAAAPAIETQADNPRPANLLTRLLNGDEALKLSLPQVEPYLEHNRRSAESLLAAFRVTDDPALLREAVEKYPKDPRVNFAACFAFRNESSPEDRRQRLEAFKQSAPDNALANYLSAQEHFNSGQTDQAVQELMVASGQSKFQDYSGDFVQNAEEAYLAAGYSEADAKALAAFGLPLPQLATLRGLGRNIGALATLYQQAGDAASAQAALQMGVNLGRQVGEPSGQNYLIGDLVGLAIERQILERMDPAGPYDGAGTTVKDRLEELARRREMYKEFQGPVDDSGRWSSATDVMESLSEQERISFFDRIKVSGEIEALRWARNRLGRE